MVATTPNNLEKRNKFNYQHHKIIFNNSSVVDLSTAERKFISVPTQYRMFW